MQAKLLRALQERVVRPVGSRKEIDIDVRVVAATHRNLEEEVAAGRFREDLYYRIRVVAMRVPPLRERREDIPLLVDRFLRRKSGDGDAPPPAISPAALSRLQEHDWPGNVRELQNTIERALVLHTQGQIGVADLGLPRAETRRGRRRGGGRQDERKRLQEALERNDWNVVNTCSELEMPRSTLYRKLKKYRLQRPKT
jgi:DNA-binding NtrC family response regulator